MVSILITGANRGLGFGLVKELLAHRDPPALIIATYRNENTSKELFQLAKSDPRVVPLRLETSDVDSFSKFTEQVEREVGPNGLNVLINNAGIGKRATFDELKPEDFLEIYQTNVLGPIFLIKALLPLLKKAADANKSKQGMNKAAILNISSLLGSVGANTIGRYHAYRESKAALNMFSRSLQVELQDTGIIVLPIHPGWVQTDLGGAEAPLTVEQSTSGMCKIFYELDDSKNGQFLQWDGQVLEW